MKKILWSGLCILLSLSNAFTQSKEVEDLPDHRIYKNWHRKDVSRKVMGIDLEKAYDELLSTRTPKKKIIVAVIDGGVDVNHEDLMNNIWTNTGEIPGNGIDDDNNGYIDDIHGWNYLGNKDGENIELATLEVTRIARTLKTKFGDAQKGDIRAKDTAEYNLYIETKEKVEAENKSGTQRLKQIKTLRKDLVPAKNRLSELTGQSFNNLKELKAVKAKTSDEKKLKKALIYFYSKGISPERLDEGIEYFNDQTKGHYNLSFFPRKDIIGDDLTDIEDVGYGNNDVKGPDASHGTFCAGIIAASINNSLGIDGISNSVEIMGLRAVPNGDEYDKDVALAIRYAVDNGAQVVNMSFGKSYSPQKWMVDEAIKYAEERGVLLVHAAGNSNKDLDVSDNYPSDQMNDDSYAVNVLTIGASTIKPKKTIAADFSNYGKKRVDFFAPGHSIISTHPDNNYDQGNGTSFAAPVVSGVAALVWSYFPELTRDELKEILMTTTTDKSDTKVILPGEEDVKVEFGKLSVAGGVVNAYDALVKAIAITNQK